MILSSSLQAVAYDPFYGVGNLLEVQQDLNLSVSVIFQPATSCGAVGCNFSIGFAFDTIENFATSSGEGHTNSLNANPSNTFTALPREPNSVSVSAQFPENATNLSTHQWKLSVVNFFKKDNASRAETVVDLESGTLAIVSSAQMAY